MSDEPTEPPASQETPDPPESPASQSSNPVPDGTGLDGLAEAMTRLLRGGIKLGLHPDGDGWVRVEHLALAASRYTAVTVRTEQIRRLGRRMRRFELVANHVRVQRGRPRLRVPDILFAPAPRAVRAAAMARGRVDGDHRGLVRLYSDPERAWQIAHQHLDDPDVLVVDSSRARRAGVRFLGTREPGTFTSTPLPVRFVLDLRPRYAEQHSAGGLPIHVGPDGVPRILLVRVTRRSGTTWEVAKGKLEPGETPEMTAVREVMEETGLRNPMRVLRHVDDVRYGFVAPGNLPRLKTVFLYLLALDGEPVLAPPAEGEGIADVGWFTPDEAAAAVSHPSLVPAMARARDLVLRYGTEPAPEYVGAQTRAPVPPDKEPS